MDRIDIYTSVSKKIEYNKNKKEGDKRRKLKTIRQRITMQEKFRERDLEKKKIFLTNGEMDINNIMKYCRLDKDSVKFMEKEFTKI